MSVRTDFISTSIFEILQEGVAAAECIQQEGVDTYPILGYLLQSVFLRMTGYEEQKLRNICWKVATMDLDYRYQMIQGRVSYGEYSSLEDKKKVYDLLREKTRALGVDFALDTKKVVMLYEVKTEMETVMKDSLISNSFPADYHQYGVFVKSWKKEHFASGGQLLGGTLEKVYEALYKQRNRCAHNTLSYQQDTITFIEMQDSQMINSNYFSYFAILLLLDKIFTEAFHIYLEAYRMKI